VVAFTFEELQELAAYFVACHKSVCLKIHRVPQAGWHSVVR
jgi:hypothetical protein